MTRVHNTAVQRQKAISFDFTSEQIPPFSFADQNYCDYLCYHVMTE